MKRMRRNDGAALVAVLIGVLFITILASSLLYMSTLNFQMKKMRYSATDNFYTAEFALEDMLAQMRQKTEMHSDSVSTYEELVALLKGPVINGYQHFNEENLRDLISIDGRKYNTDVVTGAPVVEGVKGIKVSTIYREANASDDHLKDYGAITRNTYEDTGSSIILHGIEVTVTTDDEHGNYESSISMDLEFAFPEYATKKSGSVSDFSILSDSPIFANEGTHVFTGSMYCRANGNGDTGEKNAMRIGSKGLVSLIGPFAFFQGNVQVDDYGTLFISGDAYINGNFNPSNKATVIVSGNLYVRGRITNRGVIRTSPGATVSYDDSTVDWEYYDNNFGSGLAHQITNEYFHIFLDPTNGTIAGIAGKRNDLQLDSRQFRQVLGDNNLEITDTVDGKTVTVAYTTKTADNTAYENALVFSFNGMSMRNTSKNSTIINIGSKNDSAPCIKFTDNPSAANIAFGHMDEESFQAAQKIFFPGALASLPWNASLGKFSFAHGGNTSLIEPDTSAGAETNQYILKNASGSVVDKLILYTHEGDNQQPYYRSLNKGTDGYVQYIPSGSLISSDMGDVMDRFYAGISGGSASSGGGGGNLKATSTIIITHWTKE